MFTKEELQKYQENDEFLISKSGQAIKVINTEKYPLIRLKYNDRIPGTNRIGLKKWIHVCRIISEKSNVPGFYWDLTQIDNQNDLELTQIMMKKLFKCKYDCLFSTTSERSYKKHLNDDHGERNDWKSIPAIVRKDGPSINL